jgi:parallel beta-helix repeat protein
MLRKACTVIAAFFIFGKILLYSQTADSVITSFDLHDTWGTGPGVADYISSANYNSNAVAALASSWAGASAAASYLYKDIFLDLEKPSIVKVRVSYTFMGGTVNYGFGSFSSISTIVGANGVNYQRDIDPAFGPDDIVDKLVSLVGLLGFYPAAAASSAGMLIEIVDIFGDIMEYADLAQNLMEMNETERFTTTFRFKYDPAIVNRIKVGVRANSAGALTGSGTAIIAGQVEKIELFIRQGDGNWVQTNPSASHQWVKEEISGFEEGYQWYDRKLDDISQNDHKGTYHPYTIVPGNDNYFYRHEYSIYDYMESLILNSPYSSYSGPDDEYISLEYNSSDLRTLQRGGTFEAWVKPEGSEYSRGHIIYLGDKNGGDGLGDHGEIHLSTNPDGRFEFYMGDDDNSLHIRTDTSFITLNEWTHVLVSYLNIDNTMDASLYINGQEVATGSKSGSIDPGLKQAHLGKPDANTRYFNGRLKGIHIRQETYGPSKALMAYYRAGGDITAPEIPQIAGIPSLYAGNSVTIHWNDVTDDKSGVEKYHVTCQDVTNPLNDQDTTLTISHVLFDSLLNGHEYEFRVQAVDSAGNRSAWSEIVSTMIDTVDPGTPVIFPEPEYTPTDSNTITWSPVTDNMDRVDYFVEICNTPDFNPYDSVNTTLYDTSHSWIEETEYTFYNLEHHQTYFYRVIARDAAGNRSDWSNIVQTTQDYNKPYPPVLNPEPEYSAGDQNHVSWSPPPGLWESLEYQVIASFSPDYEDYYISSFVRGTDTTLYNVSNEDDLPCYFFVRAKNEHGVWSNWSDPENTIQDFDIPEKPLVDPLPSSTSNRSITLSFSNDYPTNTLTDLTHQIRYADNRDFQDAVIVNVGETHTPAFYFNIGDRRLYFQVRTLHGNNVGEWSDMVYTTYSPPSGRHDTYYVSADGNDNISPNLALTPEYKNFRSIGKAFEYILPGDTIKVMPGDYVEFLTVDKPVTIMAHQSDMELPVIKNVYSAPFVFHIQNDHVNLFRLRFSVDWYTTGHDTILPVIIDQVQSCEISENIFENNPLKLTHAMNTIIRGNQFLNSPGGIISENSSKNHFLENTFLDGASLSLVQSFSNSLHNNLFNTYGDYGILLSESNFNTLTDNSFTRYEKYWMGLQISGITITTQSEFNNISSNSFSLAINKPLYILHASHNLITASSFFDHYNNDRIFVKNSHNNMLPGFKY